MKRLALLLTATLAVACLFGGCAVGTPDDTIVVGASPTPHAEILEVIRPELEAAGYKLDIRTFDDYVTPNTALEEGSLDANYFQHTPYLSTFNLDYNTHLVAVERIHYEPFCVYGNGVTKEDYAIKSGRTILIPNDGSNLTRALFVLRDEGFIALKEGAKPSDTLTTADIADLKGNTVNAAEAGTLTALLRESKAGTLAVINGNYALAAGLSSSDALAAEDASGDAAGLYANVIAVKAGKEESAKTKALLAALKSKKVYDFITEKYSGAVRPVFTV